MTTRRISIPALGEEFVRTPVGASAVSAVHDFCRWPTIARLTPRKLRPRHVTRYFEKVASRFALSTRTVYRHGILTFLGWLRQRRVLRFDPDILRNPFLRAALPKSAADFLESLEPTHRHSTCLGYRSTLRHFHRWLRARRLRLRALNRKQLVGWFQVQHRRGYHPSTRLGHLIQVRVYFTWLAERGLLYADPDDLVRVTDYPKIPEYLPRPFPPDFDRELQRRLSASSDRLHRALLLQRLTGMRIGELVSLPYDCLRTDAKRRSFLIVPIGKLYNERIVPLDTRALALVRWLQEYDWQPRTWLLAAPDERVERATQMRQALREAADGLDAAGPVVSHRLRHTYATSLLSGGMSLLSVMKLLGHRDFRMTLRYTAITDETIGKEYRAALAELEKKYANILTAAAADDNDPLSLLAHAASALRRLADASSSVRPLLKRIERLRADIHRLGLRRPRPDR